MRKCSVPLEGAQTLEKAWFQIVPGWFHTEPLVGAVMAEKTPKTGLFRRVETLGARAEITWSFFVGRISNPSLDRRIGDPFYILQLKTLFLRRPLQF